MKTRENIKQLKGVISVYESNAAFHPALASGKLGAARPLTKKSMLPLFKSLYENADAIAYKMSGLVPNHILKYDLSNGDMIFYTEPQMQMIAFSFDEIEAKKRKMPWLLWVINNQSLSVYALDSKPTDLKQPLYVAPLANVSSTGSVCMGNVKWKNTNPEMNGYEKKVIDLFFGSYFSESLTDRMCKINIHKAYALAENKDFDWNPYLIKNEKTLGDVL